MTTYLVRTNGYTWGIGDTEEIARKNARFNMRLKGSLAHVVVLSEKPESLRFDCVGNATWSNATCKVTEEYLIEGGKRKPMPEDD